MATSLDNLPKVNQRRKVEADDSHLQFGSIVVLNHGANDGILDLAVVQVHADLVAYFELALWFLGWHAGTIPHTSPKRKKGPSFDSPFRRAEHPFRGKVLLY